MKKKRIVDKINLLIEYAAKIGATEAAEISVYEININESLAEKCREPKCENYGLSKSCPPYVLKPSEFEKELNKFKRAVFIRIEIPKNVLFSSENKEIFRFLHETVANTEIFAKEIGFNNAKGFAGGSCKQLFCNDYTTCAVIDEKSKCRFPQYARESMSGFGIDIGKIVRKLGWDMDILKKADNDTANVYGMVLLK